MFGLHREWRGGLQTHKCGTTNGRDLDLIISINHCEIQNVLERRYEGRLLPSLVDEVGKTNPNGREESGVIRND